MLPETLRYQHHVDKLAGLSRRLKSRTSVACIAGQEAATH